MGLVATKPLPSTCLVLESDALPLSDVRSIIPVAGKVLAETLQISFPSPGLALHLPHIFVLCVHSSFNAMFLLHINPAKTNPDSVPHGMREKNLLMRLDVQHITLWDTCCRLLLLQRRMFCISSQ